MDYTLAANLEYLTLTGAAMRGTGNALANRIAGNGLANTLDGAAGADTLIGGAGNDTYIVDETGDTIIGEAVGTGDGFVDTVVAAFDYTLGDNLENLTLSRRSRRGARATLSPTGSKAMALANTLDGGKGADTLIGGAGDDTYIFDAYTSNNEMDVAIEKAKVRGSTPSRSPEVSRCASTSSPTMSRT